MTGHAGVEAGTWGWYSQRPHYLNHGKMMTAPRWILPLIVAGLSQAAWGYGEIDNLAGSTVLASGGLEHVTCPIGGNYDCKTWPQTCTSSSCRTFASPPGS